MRIYVAFLTIVLMAFIAHSALTQATGGFEAAYVGPSTNCTTMVPVGSNILAFCGTSDKGLEYSLNGSAYTPVSGSAGVASFNGRTGSVLPAAGDYSFSQLNGAAVASQLPSVSSLSGQITATQLPSTTTCTLAATVGSTDTITISACH